MSLKRRLCFVFILVLLTFNLLGCSSPRRVQKDVLVVKSHFILVGNYIFPEMADWKRIESNSWVDADKKQQIECYRTMDESKLTVTFKYVPYKANSEVPTLKVVEDRMAGLKKEVEASGQTFKVIESKKTDFQGIPAFYFCHQLIYEGENEVDTEICSLSFIQNKDLYLLTLDVFLPDSQSHNYAQEFWERLLMQIRPIQEKQNIVSISVDQIHIEPDITAVDIIVVNKVPKPVLINQQSLLELVGNIKLKDSDGDMFIFEPESIADNYNLSIQKFVPLNARSNMRYTLKYPAKLISESKRRALNKKAGSARKLRYNMTGKIILSDKKMRDAYYEVVKKNDDVTVK